MSDEKLIAKLQERIDTEIRHNGRSPDEAFESIREEYESIGANSKIFESLDKALHNVKLKLNNIERLSRVHAVRAQRAPWYTGPSENSPNWNAYKDFLAKKGWQNAIDSIDKSSTQVVSMLYNPGTPSFESRGLVLGYVQSGKTANMTAVIAKAADAGYKMIIILTGMIESLRRQTQARMESDLINLTGSSHWERWTTVDADFNAQPTNPGFQFATAHRNIMVIKKQKDILQRIVEKLKNTSDLVLNDLPVLVIDDECDQASVNASGKDNETTTLNRLIREIMEKFPRHSYVGYTATPFANVLIDPSVKPDQPLDLYPKDFIYTLPKPDDYFGAEKLFGRNLLDAEEELAEDEELDVIRLIPDKEVPFLTTKSIESGFKLTESAEAALDYFLIATAIRNCRGHKNKHSTMLYHTSHLQYVHDLIAKEVKVSLNHKTSLLNRKDSSYIQNLEDMYQFEQGKVPPSLYDHETFSFDQLLPEIVDTANSSIVVVVNSDSDDELNYENSGGNDGHRYIVVGGNVISRGLTLEGLVSSFFMRTSRQYDTLMQMGRWFGYRPGYEDLPRVWMTSQMQDIFTNLATVEADIREKIRVYEQEEPDITPLDVAVKIRQIPGLAITARNKMRSARRCHFSFAGEHRQTIHFAHKNESILNENWSAAEELFIASSENLTIEDTANGKLIRGVDRTLIEEFLHNYIIHPTHADLVDFNTGTNHLLNYITKRKNQSVENLKDWNVGLIQPKTGQNRTFSNFKGLGKIALISRSLFQELSNGDADIKSLMSRRDITIDMSCGPEAGESWESIKNRRRETPEENKPLLLLYPIDKNSEPTERKTKDSKIINSKRKPLNAYAHVMGMGIVFPKVGDDAAASHYVEVELPTPEDAEIEPEEEILENSE